MMPWLWDAPGLACLLPQLARVPANGASSPIQAPLVVLTQQPGAALRVVPAMSASGARAMWQFLRHYSHRTMLTRGPSGAHRARYEGAGLVRTAEHNMQSKRQGVREDISSMYVL